MSSPLINAVIKEQFLTQSEISISVMQSQLKDCVYPAKEAKEFLACAASAFDAIYIAGGNIRDILGAKAWFMDQLLAALWTRFAINEDTALLAVGGYGRGELHPYSDIDLLILAKDEISPGLGEALSAFITLLWDLKLDIGHSVRTLNECIESAKEDVTIATNLLETRTIIGDEALRLSLSKRVYSDEVYPSRDYFIAKHNEQLGRHAKYTDTEYNLEPNIKSSPGTLRDIQTIAWVTKRHFGFNAVDNRKRYKFLTDDEFNMLLQGETFLWSLRYGLQMVAGRNENRLLFDHQRRVASLLGYEDNNEGLGVEQMMQRYFRTVLGIGELADLILQYFDEFYLNTNKTIQISPINRRFQLNNGYIETVNDEVFDRSPYALIEIFSLMASDPEIKGIRSTTIRLIREHQYLIDESFRNDLGNTSLFREILRTPHKLHRTLNNMLKYNVLSRYLPEFASVVGQMQHDLFHVYTVDTHTINLVRNIVNLNDPRAIERFPLASSLVDDLPKLELIFVAAIYHDIAKGRGGNHSELGAQDVIKFCQRHHYSERDTQLIAWLVEHHLLMSMTAQKKDIADPDIVYEFAEQIPSLVHLDYLYVLTVCDIAATNPKLWNSWRSSLLQQLYIESRRAIRKGIEDKLDREDWIAATQKEVRTTLLTKEYPASAVNELLDSLDADYFLQGYVSDIVWQCEHILSQQDPTIPVIAIRDKNTENGQGFSQIMIYQKSDEDLFAATAAMFEQLNLNVLSARISTGSSEFSVSTFIATDTNNQGFAADKARKATIIKKLVEALDDPDDYPEIINRRTPRQLKAFAFPTEVTLSNDTLNHRTVMEVVTPDRPGLLARIGHILYTHDLVMINARIATLGERVEDVFFISQENGQPLSDEAMCTTLQHDICTQLDDLSSPQAQAQAQAS